MSGQPQCPARRIVLVERDDPPVFSCAACGWAPTPWTPEAPRSLLWAVLEHHLTVHWDRAGLDDQAAP